MKLFHSLIFVAVAAISAFPVLAQPRPASGPMPMMSASMPMMAASMPMREDCAKAPMKRHGTASAASGANAMSMPCRAEGAASSPAKAHKNRY